MDNAFVEFMESLGSFGTFILIMIVAVPLVYGCYKAVKAMITSHDKKITNQVIVSESNKHFMEDISDLVKVVNKIQGKVDSLSEKTDELKEGFDKQIQQLNEKIDETRTKSKTGDTALQDELKKYNDSLEEIQNKLNLSDEKMNLLIDSDKEGIKATITNMYYESTENGFIPIYKLQSLEPMYEKYLQENGNTFIGQLMNEMRLLPHSKEESDKKKREGK